MKNIAHMSILLQSLKILQLDRKPKSLNMTNIKSLPKSTLSRNCELSDMRKLKLE